MRAASSYHIEKAVAAICPDIQAQFDLSNPATDERALWWELSACLLSSQVPYSMAVAAADAIDRSGILLEPPVGGTVAMTQALASVLKAPIIANGKSRCYRFPNSKSNQLASAWAAISARDTIACLLVEFDTPSDARNWLVREVSGFGPKQASMFLRNIGFSYDLAVLDRHVLNYMAMIGLDEVDRSNVNRLATYGLHETHLRSHAASLGYPVGLLDWAIWIVMRAARNLERKEV